MKPMDLMDALGDVPEDLVEAAVITKPICEKKRSHKIVSRAIALTALAASFAAVFGLIHIIGKFGEQPEPVQTADYAATDITVRTAADTTAVTVRNSTETVIAGISNTAYAEIKPETTAAGTLSMNTENASQTAETTTAYTVWMFTDGTLKTVEYETTEDPYHSTAKTAAETVPAAITTYPTATFHVETKIVTVSYIPPHEVGQNDVFCWHDCQQRTEGQEAESPFDLHDSITVPALPGFQFTWENEMIAVSKDGTQIAGFSGMPVMSAYFADLTGDGVPELCVGSCFGSGMIDEHITVYDCMEQKQYDLWDRGVFDYKLSVENDSLTVERTLNMYNTAESTVKGSIVLKDGITYFVEKGKQLDTSKPPISEYADGSVLTWFDITQNAADPNETLRFRISAYPDIVFTYENEMLYFDQHGHKSMVSYAKTFNAFFADITGDGKPEICITSQVHSPLNSAIPLQVTVMDIAGQQTGHLVYYMDDQDNTYRDTDNEYDYVLYTEDGKLFVNKNSWLSAWDPFSKHGTMGKFRFKDGNLVFDEIK